MSNTRPEIRVDKNGHSVTRHIKDEASKKVSRASNIAPPKTSVTPPILPDQTAPKSQRGGEVIAVTSSADGTTYFSEKHSFNPNQPYAWDSFTVTTSKGNVLNFQVDDKGTVISNGEKWGKDIDAFISWGTI